MPNPEVIYRCRCDSSTWKGFRLVAGGSMRVQCLWHLGDAKMGRIWVRLGRGGYALLDSIYRALQFERLDCCLWAAMPKSAKRILPNGRFEGS